MNLSLKDHCRVCNGPLEEVIAFGEQPLANGFDKPDVRYPLTFCHCTDCGIYQLQEVVDPDELFGDYVYRAGSGGMQREMFHDLATAVKHVVKPQRGPICDAIIDIGGNDGSLLEEFKGCARFNVDPYGVGNDEDQLGDLIGDKVVLVRDAWGTNMTPAKGVRLIFSTNSWAHINGIHDATQGVAEALADNGYFIIQTPWIRDLLHNTLYDTIYHEHLSYWSVGAMQKLMWAHKMQVVHVDYLPKVHGGSIRCWISKDKSKTDSTPLYFQHLEALMPKPQEFKRMVRKHKVLLDDTMEDYKWAMYGCSAKGVMLANLAGLYRNLHWALDDTEEKQGKTVPGMRLPIGVHANQITDHLLLTAWNYADAIKAKLRKQGWHGTVVTPFPVPMKEYL